MFSLVLYSSYLLYFTIYGMIVSYFILVSTFVFFYHNLRK